MTSIFTKTTRDGRTVEFLIEDDGALSVTLEGNNVYRHRQPNPHLIGTILGQRTARTLDIPYGSVSYGDIVVLTPDENDRMKAAWTQLRPDPEAEFERLEAEGRPFHQDLPALPAELPEDPLKQAQFFADRHAALEATREADRRRTLWVQSHPEHMEEVRRRRTARVQRFIDQD